MLNLLDWLLWWRLDKDKVEWQAKNYAQLEFLDSSKALSLVLIVASAALSAIGLLRADAPTATVAAAYVALFVILGVFVYAGHRWAMVAAMVLWTLEKGLQFIAQPLSIFIGIFWWAIVTHAIYGALAVENLRRKSPVIS